MILLIILDILLAVSLLAFAAYALFQKRNI